MPSPRPFPASCPLVPPSCTRRAFVGGLAFLAVSCGRRPQTLVFDALPGPHGYPFNRGPGGIEMLLWHDRVLRGEAPDL